MLGGGSRGSRLCTHYGCTDHAVGTCYAFATGLVPVGP